MFFIYLQEKNLLTFESEKACKRKKKLIRLQNKIITVVFNKIMS